MTLSHPREQPASPASASHAETPPPAEHAERPASLPAFRRLWAADTVSQAGTAVTLLALPLVAIATLDATPFQAGLLVTCEYLAFLLVGLPAGAWVDRSRHRRVMIAGDLGRAVLLASVPVAALLGVLTLPQLYAVAFGLSLCTVFFDVAAQSLLPRMVDGERLVEANVRLETTRNLVQAAGPGVGGVLLAVVASPVALALDAFSYLASALLLARIRQADTVPGPDAALGTGAGDRDPGDKGRAGLRAEIGAGLRFVFRHPLLRAVTLASAISNFCGTIGAAMLMVLLAGELELSPLWCGLVFTAEAIGGLLGGLLTARLAARFGTGLAMGGSVLLSGVLWLAAVPSFQADWRFAVGVALQGLGWAAFMPFKIGAVTLRQRVCPPDLLGRVTATVRFVVWGTMPLGALVGGLLGEHFGARTALWVGAVAELFAVLPLLLSRPDGKSEGLPADRRRRTGPRHDAE
ncbi:MFS transporter [Streptomyces sp. NBC_00572]|uniref:MFS transporter n=1 Tax=Streptomyces sp. NBC_00572 TaxID=2903664 RepID=UPI0022586112|nr:MFS transporter [Streptomyces sp. NBC_00572]MCX4985877.1 MFS transporter [Streptomyces sp. NBC_00572]